MLNLDKKFGNTVTGAWYFYCWQIYNYEHSSVNIEMDSVSSDFEVQMSLFSDSEMTTALAAEHEGINHFPSLL